VPDWVEHALLWQIYPLGFVGAEAAAVDRIGVLHRLGHIGQCLDYAVELGASGLLLGPISLPPPMVTTRSITSAFTGIIILGVGGFESLSRYQANMSGPDR